MALLKELIFLLTQELAANYTNKHDKLLEIIENLNLKSSLTYHTKQLVSFGDVLRFKRTINGNLKFITWK